MLNKKELIQFVQPVIWNLSDSQIEELSKLMKDHVPAIGKMEPISLYEEIKIDMRTKDNFIRSLYRTKKIVVLKIVKLLTLRQFCENDEVHEIRLYSTMRALEDKSAVI